MIELNNPAITQLGIESIIDFYKTISVDQLYLPDLNLFVSEIDSPIFNVVLDTCSINNLEPNTIAKVTDFFKRPDRPWTWFKTAISNTSNLDELGFQLDYESRSMYFDLDDKLSEITTDLKIAEADDLREWIKPIQESFPSSDNCQAYLKMNTRLFHEGKGKFKHFLGYQHCEVACSGTLFLSTNSVMLHNLATKPKFRNRGLGSALTLYLMQEAKSMGYRHCFLDSSEEGFNLYRRLGFKIYATILEYKLNL